MEKIGRMRILIFSWRDIKNPSGGGAELLTHELAKRWVKFGHRVMVFSSEFKGSKNEEIVDGVRIIRKGNWWSVHVFAFFAYITNLKKNSDVIIDEVHWFPFFSALYAREKTVLLACEVANKLFFELFSYPKALFWRAIEKIYLAIYKNIPVLAISPSTKKDLITEGFLAQNITVFPMGLTYPKDSIKRDKEKQPTIIYLGRLNKQKGIIDAIQVLKLVKNEIRDCVLWVVGSGEVELLKYIQHEISMLQLTSSVTFFGFVSENKKFELLSRAHILIVPSSHEGWGLVVPEAGIAGTPSVVYNVSGLRDIIKDGKNGRVVDVNPSAMANAVIQLLNQKSEYKKIAKNAEESAKKYNWDNTAKVALQIIQNR